jgi:hypothetical protein
MGSIARFRLVNRRRSSENDSFPQSNSCADCLELHPLHFVSSQKGFPEIKSVKNMENSML